jgi:hypothetical protein
LVSVSRDGRINWALPIDPNVRNLSTPAIKRAGQILLTAIGGPSLYLYRVSGRQLVEKALISDGAVVSSPTLDDEGNAYVWHNIKRDGVDYGFDLTKFDAGFDVATRTWKPIAGTGQGLVSRAPDLCLACYNPEFPPADPNPSLPAPSFGTCFDFVATSYQTLRVRRSGSKVWQAAITGVRTPAMGAGGIVYVVTTNEAFTSFALEASEQGSGLVGTRSGALRRWPSWRHSFGNNLPLAPPAIGVGTRDAGDRAGHRCNANERDHRTFHEVNDVYIPAADGFLYALDYKGRVRWKQQNPERQFVSAPVVIALANGEQLIVIVDSAGDLRAFNRAGTTLWQVPLDSPTRGSPAVAHGRIYVATQRSLYAIGSPTAQPPSAPLRPGTR